MDTKIRPFAPLPECYPAALTALLLYPPGKIHSSSLPDPLLIVHYLNVPHLLPLLIRGINNLSDARYCAGMGADKLTFVLDPALPDHLDAKAMKELTGWVAGVELIGEFDRLSTQEINALAADCALDAVLLRSFRTPTELAEIAPPVYLELPADVLTAEAVPLPFASIGFVLELPAGTIAKAHSALAALAAQGRLWLGPGLHPELARKLARELPLAGLSFPSGNEVKPGLRDFDQLEAVFEALEVE